ncbi:MAG: dienelactone hydrolase [Sandarakinorhabdus sp.]|nr:dienelactone hydrolase [Sandarakinorhabdus sp.]
MHKVLALLAALIAPAALWAATPPSMPGADAPELAAPGRFAVGVKTVVFTNPGQPDLLKANLQTGAVPLHDRQLVVDIWYPALPAATAPRVTYASAFWGEPPRPPVSFTVPGIAIRDAKPVGTALPLVILSHGYSNAPAAMTWLTENLASKGYVVAGIHHKDANPYVARPADRAAPSLLRPLDIVFTARQLKALLGNQIDPERIALIGYSMGGYGVVTAGGASLDPAGPAMKFIPGGWLQRYARGTAGAAAITVPGVKAIVAMAPAGGFPSAWGNEGLAAISEPLLLIAGNHDQVVDYTTGAKAIFENAVHADRYLLTYREAGHAIGLNPAPAEMRGSVWDMDWFEDQVWRQDRVNAINLHFITAFLDLHLRGNAAAKPYLDVGVSNSDAGTWNAPPTTAWGAYSPGGEGVTLWKGFQRRHARGMDLLHAPAAAR